MKRAHLLRLLAVATLMIATTTARADLVRWGYDWSASPSFVSAGDGKVTFRSETNRSATGNSNIVATNLQVSSSADPHAPDRFGAGEGNYTLTLTLRDVESGETGTLTFTGQLQGKFSALNANVTNTFTGATVQTLQLGYTAFIVTMNSYTPPGPPEQGNLGSIGALVEVSSLRPADTTPEPTALALAGIGAGFAGLSVWKKRRRKRAR